MFRLFLLTLVTIHCGPAIADDSSASSTNEITERKPHKEPRYDSVPKYAVMTLGTSSKTTVWMVEDGKRLFVDKNANSDLTDDGPPIEPSDVRDLGNGQQDFNYELDAIVSIEGSRHTTFGLRRWNYGDKVDSYGLSINVDDRTPMYAGWFGTFWSSKPESTPSIPFGGPLTPKLLRAKEITITPTAQRMSLAFMNLEAEAGAVSRLSIEALNRSVVPRLTIAWPTANGETPLKTTHDLTERCCYWEFYTSDLYVPDGVKPGMARVGVTFPGGGFPFTLTTSVIEVPVTAAKEKPTK
jgi:hypothetical protein